MEPPALICGESIRQEGRAARCWRIAQAARHSGRPPQINPTGRALLAQGCVERLGRVPDTACAILLPLSQNRPAQVVPSKNIVLSACESESRRTGKVEAANFSAMSELLLYLEQLPTPTGLIR